MHVKLLVGFLLIAVLLLALGLFSIGVLNRVDGQVDSITALHAQSDRSREMIYKITAQSHFRAMALLTGTDTWDDKIYTAKEGFVAGLAAAQSMDVSRGDAFFDDVEIINLRFEGESRNVSDLYFAGDFDRAEDLHLQVEHETSHELEAELNGIIADADRQALGKVQEFDDDRRLLTIAVAAFSLTSLGVALLLGAVLSWSYPLPKNSGRRLALL